MPTRQMVSSIQGTCHVLVSVLSAGQGLIPVLHALEPQLHSVLCLAVLASLTCGMVFRRFVATS